MRQILRYRSYRLLARADFAVRQGVDASYDVGADFQIAFELEDYDALLAAKEHIGAQGIEVLVPP